MIMKLRYLLSGIASRIFIVLVLFSGLWTTAQSATFCVDSASDEDGDGWGWENHQSCQVIVATGAPSFTLASAPFPGPATASDRPIAASDAPAITADMPARCTDPDGDGHDLVRDTSCIFNDGGIDSQSSALDTQTSELDNQPPIDAPELPPCEDANSDPDGDGFGWENYRTCVTSTDSVEPATQINALTAPLSQPVCTSAASDPDGDGYGWENYRSCIVSKTSQEPAMQIDAASPQIATPPAQIDTTPVQTIAPSPSSQPMCASADSDPDLDGFGWENSRTCVVVAEVTEDHKDTPDSLATIEPQDTTTPKDNPSAPVSAELPIRFMAVGDSITHGSKRELVESYRPSFIARMTEANCSFDMVGSQTTNSGHASFVSPHESYSGHRADDFLNGRHSSSGDNQGIATSLHNYMPDVVLLFLGTNDILQGHDIAETVAEMDQVISLILDSGASVFVANVTPVYRSSVNYRIRQYGDQLEAYITQLGNVNVKLVDVRSGFIRSMMLDDDLHPNDAGDGYIAQQFFDRVIANGFCLEP